MKSLHDLVEAGRLSISFSPWIKEQTTKRYSEELINEIEELKQGIENNDLKNIKEEIGDVFWDALVLLLIAEKEYGFDAEEPLNQILEKMKRRKPHVFEKRLASIEEEREVWHRVKAEEKK
ncbi:hypothetical protein GOV05_04640 [Candidatus Woesearchaeota archaeon]|nr:hypothetical protein [Candidatus Woesearchaeota archaeon]